MAKKEDPQVTLAKEHRAWELRSRGWSDARIATEMGVSAMTVNRILARVTRRALESMPAQVAEQRMVEQAMLEYLYSESLDGWERSKRHPGRGQRRQIQDKEEAEAEVVYPGDPKFLQVCVAIRQDIKKIWGLNAPEKHILAKVPVELSPEEREIIARQLGIPNDYPQQIKSEPQPSDNAMILYQEQPVLPGTEVEHEDEDDILAVIDDMARSSMNR